MNPNEFMLFYVILPWGLALIGIGLAVIVWVLGGKELRTIMAARLDPRAQFVFSWTDGGHATLETYHPFEHGVLEGDKKYLLYGTQLTAKEFTPQLLTVDQVKAVMPNMGDDAIKAMVEKENASRIEKAKSLADGMPQVNTAAKANCIFSGKPCWLGYQSIGVAVTPELLTMMDKRKRKSKGRTQSDLEVVSVDTIKEFLTMNFSPRRLFQIFRTGEDYGLHGKPKKPFPTILILILLFAIGGLLIGGLILTGKLDLGGWAKGLLG